MLSWYFSINVCAIFFHRTPSFFYYLAPKKLAPKRPRAKKARVKKARAK
jgi:hypothetical protein